MLDEVRKQVHALVEFLVVPQAYQGRTLAALERHAPARVVNALHAENVLVLTGARVDGRDTFSIHSFYIPYTRAHGVRKAVDRIMERVFPEAQLAHPDPLVTLERDDACPTCGGRGCAECGRAACPHPQECKLGCLAPEECGFGEEE